MASHWSDYAADNILNTLGMAAAFPAGTSLYLAFYTVNPTHADTGTEVTGYTRPLFATTTTTTRVLTNSGTISISNFPTASIVAVALRDAATVGNLIVLNDAYTLSVTAGNTYTWGAGTVTFDLSA